MTAPARTGDFFRDIRRECDPVPELCAQTAGVDEAGRGPIAGPVVTAAVILDPDCVPDGLDDSKVLTAERREELFKQIMACATVSVCAASPRRIAVLNIRGATLWAMNRAVSGLNRAPRTILVDGRDQLPGRESVSIAIIKGDARHAAISAASIVAKVARDRLMTRAERAFPGYGFDRHMGYGTPAHMDALTRLGPCALHRETFAPVAALVAARRG
ncbi:ribonuclease HII [Tepidamorphus sp. 3E244]|uniref:ribonuclease HII n=1 Tax=Tepidamorphus sp. 3E244 TaxID=3385498 RepID=UPI0038FC7D08